MKQNRTKGRGYIAILLIAALLITADQLSKQWIRINLAPGNSIPEEGFLRLTHVRNSGAAFGLDIDQTILIGLSIIVAIAISILYIRYFSHVTRVVTIGVALLLGGEAGNLIDRIRLGHVTDFMDVGPWPVFNVADSCITVGAIMLASYLLFSTIREGKQAQK